MSDTAEQMIFVCPECGCSTTHDDGQCWCDDPDCGYRFKCDRHIAPRQPMTGTAEQLVEKVASYLLSRIVPWECDPDVLREIVAETINVLDGIGRLR